MENHLKHVKRRFINPRYIHLVATINGEIIGFAGAELKSTKTAYMLKGYVEPSCRRKGVMRKMEARLIEILRQKGITKLDLRVDSNNREGKSTWIALGYRTLRETMGKQI